MLRRPYMGYTHYFTVSPLTSEWWSRIRPKLEEIVEFHKDVIVRDDGTDLPIVACDSICFNGIGENAHETFLVDCAGAGWHFCKTQRKPYDQAVCECLLVLCKYVKGVTGKVDFTASSDGADGNVGEPGFEPFEDSDGWHAAIARLRGLYPDEGF